MICDVVADERQLPATGSLYGSLTDAAAAVSHLAEKDELEEVLGRHTPACNKPRRHEMASQVVDAGKAVNLQLRTVVQTTDRYGDKAMTGTTQPVILRVRHHKLVTVFPEA